MRIFVTSRVQTVSHTQHARKYKPDSKTTTFQTQYNVNMMLFEELCQQRNFNSISLNTDA